MATVAVASASSAASIMAKMQTMKEGITLSKEVVETMQEALELKALAEEITRLTENIAKLNQELRDQGKEISHDMIQAKVLAAKGLEDAVEAVLTIKSFTQILQRWTEKVLNDESNTTTWNSFFSTGTILRRLTGSEGSQDSDTTAKNNKKLEQFSVLLKKYQRFATESTRTVDKARNTIWEAVQALEKVGATMDASLGLIDREVVFPEQRKQALEANRNRPEQGHEFAIGVGLVVLALSGLAGGCVLASSLVAGTAFEIPVLVSSSLVSGVGASASLGAAAQKTAIEDNPDPVLMAVRRLTGQDVNEATLRALVEQIEKLRAFRSQLTQARANLTATGNKLQEKSSQLVRVSGSVRPMEYITEDVQDAMEGSQSATICFDLLRELLNGTTAVIDACNKFLDDDQ